MQAPSFPWTDAQVANTAGTIRAMPHATGRILYRIASAYGLHAYGRAQGIKPASLHLNGCDGAEIWTSSQEDLMADPAAGLSTFLRAIEGACS